MPDPTFLLIGGQKCGTTWMARMLAQHPDVFVPERKELRFFDRPEEHRRGLAWYRAHFAAAHGRTAVGECTPNYLGICGIPPSAIEAIEAAGIPFSPHPEVNHDVAPLVARDLPDIRLLVLLRNPVDRAVSSYHHQIAMRRISPRTPFAEAAGRQGILSMGFYAHHLRRWFDHFDRARFHIAIYEEDLRERPLDLLSEAYAHLGVDADFVPSGVHERVGERASPAALFLRYYAPRSSRRLLRRVPSVGRLPVPSARVTDEDRAWLSSLYAADVADLEGLLGRPLTCWARAGTPTDPVARSRSA